MYLAAAGLDDFDPCSKAIYNMLDLCQSDSKACTTVVMNIFSL